MITTIVTALVAFISTNIDDIFVLILFFSQRNKSTQIYHIVLGQYLGIGLLTIISIIGALGISIISENYIGLLGLIPIFLGVKEYLDYKRNTIEIEEGITNKEIEAYTNKEIIENKEKPIISFLKRLINPSVIKVVGVTLANGSDNIGIYVPIFSGVSLLNILVILIIFIILTAIWCFIAIKLVEYPFINRSIEKYNHIFVPIIFIGLGVFILIQSGTVSFILKKLF